MLIRPPAHHALADEVPKAVSAENQSYPPLGLLALATWLERNTPHLVRILDAQFHDLDEQSMGRQIRAFAPQVVGISCFTVQLVDIVAVLRIARACPSVRYIVLGGPHVNDFPHQSRALPGVDAVIRGEGQRPLQRLLQAWEHGADIRGIPGISPAPDGPAPDFVYTTDQLDTLPIPDRTLIDYRLYYDVIGKGSTFATLVTSRGCPHRCTFCNTPHHRYRSMSPGRICDEVQACKDLGMDEIYFVDDTFNINNERVLGFCDEVSRRDLRFSWTARCRVNGVDARLLHSMKAAGCRRIQFGVEQGTDEGLERLQKGVTIRQVEEAFRLCRQVGIQTVAYFMIGTPTERTRQDVLRTIDYAVSLDSDFVMFNILTPFPGTRLFQEGVDEGILSLEPWNRFMSNPSQDFKPPLWEQYLDREELRGLLSLAYRRFYWRPRFLARNLLRSSTPHDILRKARAGIRLLQG